MRLLAITTATDVCGIALTENNQQVAEYVLNRKNVYNEKLISAIQNLVAEAGWQLTDLSGLALVTGPGSFTGLRIGLAAAKGLAFVLDIPVLSVNSLDALAQAVNFWSGRICVVIKARATEVYFGLYEKDSEILRRCGDYRIMPLREAIENLSERTFVVCPTELAMENLDSEKIVWAPADYRVIRPFTVAQMGYEKLLKKETADLDSLEPFYLKDFEPKRKVYDYDKR